MRTSEYFLSFYSTFTYSSVVMGWAFLTPPPPSLQMKYIIPDNTSTMGLKFSPKGQLLRVGKKRIFSKSNRTNKTYRKL